MKTIMPEIEGHLVAEQSWFTLASMVYKNHGAVTLHVVTDENDSKVFVPALQKSNGKEGPHGYYKFRDIVWEPAARISSATDLRAAVAANDRAAFERAAGVPADTRVAGRPFFDVVKHFLTPYLDQAAAKEADKASKAKLKADKEKAKPVKKTKEPERDMSETARMSAAAKLSKAWDRQQAKSAASRKRGQELLNPPKKEEPKTQPVSEKFHIFKRFKKTRK
jgi:hypothetical protein